MSEIFEVEKIIDCRKIGKRRTEYLIKWAGYGDHENTWEPENNLVNANRALKEFLQSREKMQESEDSYEEEDSSRSEKVLKVSPNRESKPKKITQKLRSKSATATKSKLQSEKKKSKQERKQVTSEQENKPNPPKINRTITKASKPKNEVKVLGMQRLPQNKGYEYRVSINGENKWVGRHFFGLEHLAELCEFYEKNLIFD